MTTGYYAANWRQGGGAPGKLSYAAGQLINLLDYVLVNNGPSPWTKTVLGTNQAAYTAPGGSQVTLNVYDDIRTASNIYSRLTATVGGQTFPTPAQEANGSLGYVLCQIASSATADVSYHYGWHAIRTDRFFLLRLDSAYWQPSATGGLCVGDIPTLDPADPGLCVLMGTRYSVYPTGSGAENFYEGSNPHTSVYFGGYAYATKTLSLFSVPASTRKHHYTNSNGNLIADWGGKVPIFPTLIYTGTSSSSSLPILRGWIPYFYQFPTTDGVAIGDTSGVYTGDTFSAGAATFELARTGSTYIGWMTNDQEDLP
jgi:hypothetical protein